MNADKALLRPVPVPVPARVQVVPASASALRLQVDRLVLHGLPLLPRDAGRVESAFRRELEQRIAARPQRLRRLASGAVDALRLEALKPGPGSGSDLAGYPEQLGRTLARALWRGLERGSGR